MGSFVFSKTDSVWNYSKGRYDNRNIHITLDDSDTISVSQETANPFDSPISLSNSAYTAIQGWIDFAIQTCSSANAPDYEYGTISSSFDVSDYSKVQSVCEKGVSGVPQFLDYGEIYPVQSCYAHSDTNTYAFTVVMPHVQSNEQFFRVTVEIGATISDSNSAHVEVWAEYIGQPSVQ